MNNSLPLLESIIQNLIKDLENYAQRENANQIYINKQNLLIKNLVLVYNSDENNSNDTLVHYDAWREIETAMSKLEQKDTQISGHTIHVRTRQKGNNFTIININSF
jgi:hypothetical protein